MKIEIYTDGSCSGNPGPGGWAAVILTPKDIIKKAGFEANTTNNRMELLAVINAVRFAAKQGLHKTYHIYSDSSYVVNAVNKDWIKKWKERKWKTVKNEDVKNKDLWLILIDLLQEVKHNNFKTIRIIKVKGHSFDIYNNLADKLAKEQVSKEMAQQAI